MVAAAAFDRRRYAAYAGTALPCFHVMLSLTAPLSIAFTPLPRTLPLIRWRYARYIIIVECYAAMLLLDATAIAAALRRARYAAMMPC